LTTVYFGNATCDIFLCTRIIVQAYVTYRPTGNSMVCWCHIYA